ncbi:MAG TPA: M1 family aminopeptidase [Longimicrobiales bacterium]|nr:M1 family aminopeptidase [Longimicrobiales bacterium]
MKLREVFRYELAYRLRSGSTWIYAGALLLVAFLVFHATADSDVIHLNAPIRLAGLTLIAGMLGMLVTAALFGDAAVRDVAVEMDPLLFTSPLRKAEHLGGRFLAALAVNAIVALAVPLGLFIATLASFLNPEGIVGPFRLSAYLQPYLLLLLPNLVLVGALLFTTAALTRQVVPVYLAAIGLLIGNVVAANYAGHIQSAALVLLVDPLGLCTLQQLAEYLTAAEQNARLLGLPEMLGWNRLAWLAVAMAVLALLHRTFRFEHAGIGGRRRTRRAIVGPESMRPVPLAIPRVVGSFGFRTTLRQVLAIAGHSLAEAAASRWFAVVLLACTGLPLLWGWNVGSTVFDTSTWPVTLLVTETVLGTRFALVPHLLLILYAGELVWKDRDTGVAEIADAAPLPDGAALLGRLLALAAMLVLFLAAAMIGGLLIQALQGYYRFEPGLYLRVVFGLQLSEYLLLAVLAMTIHVLVNHKYVGHVIVALAVLFTKIAPAFGIRHNLLVYNGDPGWTYSDMNGFGPFIGPFAWFKAYWAAWALLLAVVASVSWVRGREPGGVRRRLRQAGVRFTKPVLRTAGVAIALILGLGGFIFYNTNVLNEYRSPMERAARWAEYEQRYVRHADTPQPTIAAAGLRVEIHPAEPAVDLRGSYRLMNRTETPIDSVHVYLRPEVRARSISLERAAAPVLIDEELGYRIYALEQPLEPGESLQLGFDVSFRPRGFPNSGLQTDVVGNGASFNRSWLPFIGYQPMFELADDEAREHLGLAPRPAAPGPGDAASLQDRWPWRDADLVDVDMIVGTAADQVAVTIGALQRSWMENGRRYFHYATEQPTAFGATVFSARYALREDRWQDIPLSIFHHRAHTDNLDRMMRGMKASLEYYTAQFGPYPDRQLRIVEIPRYGGFGSAHPHTVAFTEDVFFSRVREGEVDQPFYGTAHEVAHTWWGGWVRGAAGVRGAGFLSESLANYSAMMVTEKTYGLEMARRVYGFQLERYLRGRATQAREVPLVEVEDQPYIAYRKGAIAMYTLREHIGEERVNTALRRYFEKHRDGRPPYPTSLDLLAELRAVTPEALRYLLTDWFETVTLWDVETKRAVVERTTAGGYQVTLDVVAKKLHADSTGNETEVPMDDLVEIGVFAAGEGDGPGEPLYLRRHRIRSGEQTIRVTVPRAPARAGIDPYRMLIDRTDYGNVLEVQAAAGSRRSRPVNAAR